MKILGLINKIKQIEGCNWYTYKNFESKIDTAISTWFEWMQSLTFRDIINWYFFYIYFINYKVVVWGD